MKSHTAALWPHFIIVFRFSIFSEMPSRTLNKCSLLLSISLAFTFRDEEELGLELGDGMGRRHDCAGDDEYFYAIFPSRDAAAGECCKCCLFSSFFDLQHSLWIFLSCLLAVVKC
jgi:hypothetical protein